MSKNWIYDLLFVALLSFLLFHAIKNPAHHCSNPINYWLINTYSLLISKWLLLLLMRKIENPKFFKFLFLIIASLIFIFIYWTIHGTIWISQENKECINSLTPNYLFYLVLGGSYIFIIFIFCYTAFEIYNIYRMIRVRRRIEEILNNLDNILSSNLLGETDNEEQGFTENDIKNLNVRSFKEEEAEFHNKDSNCTICIENFIEKDAVVLLPGCGHNFHFKCIKAWFEKKPFCPNCKRNIKKEIEKRMKDENLPV